MTPPYDVLLVYNAYYWQAKSFLNAMHIHINALILYFLTFFVTNRTLCDVIEKHGVAEDAALIAGLPRSYIAIIAVVGIVGLAIIVLVTVIVLVIADFVSVIFLVATHVNHDEVFVIYIYFISQTMQHIT